MKQSIESVEESYPSGTTLYLEYENDYDNNRLSNKLFIICFIKLSEISYLIILYTLCITMY